MRLRSAWFGCCWLCAVATAHAEPRVSNMELTPGDFAYARRVLLPADASALVQVELPVDVYRYSRTPGLQDVLVFNARGTQVPHALRIATSQAVDAPSAVSLPAFPVPMSAAWATAERVETAVKLERSADGQVLRITSRTDPSGAQAKPQPVAAYLLDARALTRAVVRLHFELAGVPDHLLLPLSVEASPDLIRWSPVAVDGALLHLKQAEHSVERSQLEIAPTRARFFRVRPVDQTAFPVSISGVSADLAPNALPRQLLRVDALGHALAADGGTRAYRFDLGGAVPVDRLELELPEENTVIAAELWSAERAEGPYQRRLTARFYRIAAAGKVLSGPSFELPRQSPRYYELRVDATRPGLGSGSPRLVTYHAPDQLLFLRRGEAPFALAYGRHGVARQRFEAEDLLALVPTREGTAAAIATAALQPAKLLGGVALLEPPKPAPPYKTYALWAALLCGVALLASLAYRLVRGQR